MTPTDRARLQFAGMIAGRLPHHAAALVRSVPLSGPKTKPMKTTDTNAREYIATLSLQTLQQFAFDAFAALGKDGDGWIDTDDDFPSGADVCEALDGALSDAKITIHRIEAWKEGAR